MANDLKAATIRNLWYLRVAQPVEMLAACVGAIRSAIAAEGLEDEFTAAERSSMQNVETAIASLAALPGITSAASRYVPSHRAKTVVIAGVNE